MGFLMQKCPQELQIKQKMLLLKVLTPLSPQRDSSGRGGGDLFIWFVFELVTPELVLNAKGEKSLLDLQML